MTRGRAARLASSIALASLAPRAAIADDPPPGVAPHATATIAVLALPGDRFGLRVVAELESLGFHVTLVDPALEPASRASLEGAARRAGAIAAIRAVPSDRGVEVWVTDRVTGKTVLREVPREGARDEDAVAVRAVELLRASLLETALPDPPRGEVPAPPDLDLRMRLPPPGALAPVTPPSLRFSLEPGVLLSPGGLGPAGSLDLGLAWMPSDHVGVSAFASIPLTGPSAGASAGSVALRAVLTGVGARFVFTSPASRWAPSADLGLAAAVVETSGTASAGRTPHASSVVTAAAFARVGVAYAVSRLFRARADVLVGGLTGDISLRVEGLEVATWGQPLVIVSAGVDFGWF